MDFMKYFLFNVWEDDVDGYKEVLIGADTQEEAEDKLDDSKIDFDDYSFEEEIEYDDVVI